MDLKNLSKIGMEHSHKNFCWPAAKWSDFIGWKIFSANVSAAHVCFHQNEAFSAANLPVFAEFGFTCEFATHQDF